MTRRRRLWLGWLVVVVLALVGLLRLSPLWPGPSLPTGATPLTLATEPAHLVPTFACETALLAPGRVTVVGDALVLVPEAGGAPVSVVWPTGWAAWRRDGRAELVDRDGTVVGREGDIVQGFGGGLGADDAFHVCQPGD
ncbi:MAG TPA: hypothetical protein VMH24_01330 [Candidatus Sulfotelmatobacter sp.]|nr:hypothetical protein [Candidatus Sulfotelmatobacter sp.]